MNSDDFIIAFESALSKFGLINFIRVANCLIVSKDLVSSDKANVTISKIEKHDLIDVMTELGCSLSTVNFIHNIYTMKSYVSRVVIGIENGKLDISFDLLVDKTFPTITYEEGDFENRQKQQDDMRERRRAEMSVRNQNYFDQMKQRVITDGVDLNQGKLTY